MDKPWWLDLCLTMPWGNVKMRLLEIDEKKMERLMNYYTPQKKTNVTIEKQPFEDASPLKNGDF